MTLPLMRFLERLSAELAGRRSLLAALGVGLLFCLFLLAQKFGGATWDENVTRQSYDSISSFAADVLQGKRDRDYPDLAARFYGILSTDSIVSFAADVLQGKRGRDYPDLVDKFYGLLPAGPAVLASEYVAPVLGCDPSSVY